MAFKVKNISNASKSSLFRLFNHTESLLDFFLGGIFVEMGTNSRKERLFVLHSKFRPTHH